MPETEADTCRVYVLPKLYGAGWTDDQIQEQHSFTDGRIVPTAKRIRRLEQKRADYRLRYTRDFPIAIVEAKAGYKTAGEGLQQAKEYAEILDLKFAYATNGKEIIEFDFLTGVEQKIDSFPSPAELWARLRRGKKLSDEKAAEQLLTPCHHQPGRQLRYYQEIAVNRVIEAIIKGRRRILLTMATGTGKTITAFQICWKLWNALWNSTGGHRRPKILYLADRNILIDERRQKYYVDGGQVEIAAHLVYELDPNGKQLQVVKYTDYTASKVRTLFPNAADSARSWADPGCRNEIIEALAERGIEFDELAEASRQPDADPFDLLCHVAFNAPLRTRRERADRLKKDRKDFFDKYAPEARRVLEELLEKYTEHGTAQFVIPEILEVPPLSEHGNVLEIADKFGGVDKLREAIAELQTLLYAAA